MDVNEFLEKIGFGTTDNEDENDLQAESFNEANNAEG